MGLVQCAERAEFFVAAYFCAARADRLRGGTRTVPYRLHEPQPCLLAESGVKAAWVFAEVVQVGMFCFDLGLVFVVTLVYLNLLFYSCSFF